MGLKLSLIFFTGFLLCLQFPGLLSQKKKDCQFSKFERRINSLVGCFGYKDHKWPENENEMTRWCNAVSRDKPAAKNFTLECLTGMSKTMGSVIVYSAEKADKLFCRNKVERNNYIGRGKCGNRMKKETIKCWQGLNTLITNMKKLPDPKDKIPTLCCAFFWWKDCTLGAYRKKCTETEVDQMEQHIDKGSLDALNLICSDYDESDKCTGVNKNFDLTKVATKYKTFFPALFDFFNTL